MKKLIIIFIVILVILSFYKLGKVFSSGSYPYSEIFEVNMSDSSLIKKVEIFKQKNPTFNAPSVTELTDNNSVTGNRYICYFYYKEENQIILTWIKAIDEKQTQFAIVSINDGLELGKWKELNKDYDYFETIKEREKFEKRILQPMQISFKRKSFF